MSAAGVEPMPPDDGSAASPAESAAPPRDAFGRIEQAFAALAHWALFAMLALVIVQVFTRYVVNDPFGEVVTITETYLMPGIVFFTIAALQRDDGHIRVDLIYGRLQGRAKQAVDLLIALLSIAFWTVVVYASAAETAFSWRMGYEVSKNFPVPVATAIGVVPVGGALILVRLVFQAVGSLRALGRPAATAGAHG